MLGYGKAEERRDEGRYSAIESRTVTELPKPTSITSPTKRSRTGMMMKHSSSSGRNC